MIPAPTLGFRLRQTDERIFPKLQKHALFGPWRRAKSSAAMTRCSGSESLGMVPGDYTEIPEVQEDREIDGGTMIIAVVIE